MNDNDITLEDTVRQFVDYAKREGTMSQALTIRKIEWRPTETRIIEARAIMSDGSIANFTFTPPLAS